MVKTLEDYKASEVNLGVLLEKVKVNAKSSTRLFCETDCHDQPCDQISPCEYSSTVKYERKNEQA